MADPYPDYDVLAKWDSPSWNDKTRRVIAERVRIGEGAPRFLDRDRWETLCALADHVVPQPRGRAAIPAAALVDAMLDDDLGQGFRHAAMPKQREAWTRALDAIEDEARRAGAPDFAALTPGAKDRLIKAMRDGRLKSPVWRGMPCNLFFSEHVVGDLIQTYYAHPSAWSAIGFGGPASPRGYVRLEPGIIDPWEAVEAAAGRKHHGR
jgi:hypothetical protein